MCKYSTLQLKPCSIEKYYCNRWICHVFVETNRKLSAEEHPVKKKKQWMGYITCISTDGLINCLLNNNSSSGQSMNNKGRNLNVDIHRWLAFPIWKIAATQTSYWVEKLSYTHSWCNGYRRRIWTQRNEFKSWTWLIAFHIALILLGKVWIQIFSLQLWVNSRAD